MREKSKKLTKYFLVTLACGLVGCDSLSTRSDVATGKRNHAAPTHAPVKTVEAGPTPQTAAPNPTPAPSASTSAATPQAPTFLNKELPKIGLILGPGGMKTFAEIGVLREFAKARIPIHSIVGLEWGAVMGGLFAQQGLVNDLEWKALKLKEQELPGEGGFLSARIKAQSVGMLNDFFEVVFGHSTIESAKVEYACPAYWSREDRFGWVSRGPVKVALRACLPYPPFFTDNGGVLAAPFAVDEAAAYLRSRGANVIVLVNVLASGELMPPKLAQGEQAVENLLWSEVRREIQRAKAPVFQYVVNVNTSGHPITDYAGRRALIERGSKDAAEIVNKIVSEYGF